MHYTRSIGSIWVSTLGAVLLFFPFFPLPQVPDTTVPVAVRVGSKPKKFTIKDVLGRSPKAGENILPAVYLFLSTHCPVSDAYTSRIVQIGRTYRRQGFLLLGVFSNALDSTGDVKRYAEERGYLFPIVKDDGTLAVRLGATMTPQAVVLDRSGIIRYRGRIDDGKEANRVTSRDLEDVLEAISSDRRVRPTETPAFGCVITARLPRPIPGKAMVTYAGDVAHILYQQCLPCHRAGEVAPFSLETYRQAAARALEIKQVTANRRMPPWKADSNGEFVGERRLTERQIETIAAWSDAGAPEGNQMSLPPRPNFPSGWKLGAPNSVVGVQEPYHLDADGADVYRCFVLPTNYGEDTFLSGIEFQPGNRKVVHHVLAYLDTSGAARKLDAADSGPGYASTGGSPGFVPSGFLGGWAPGLELGLTPDGIGMLLPKEADIVLEVHYHKDGKPEVDQTRVGIHFCRTPVNKLVRVMPVLNFSFRIPPGEANHTVKASLPIQEDITALGVMPHMHLLGREISVSAVFPDGTQKRMVRVPDWDFNWQTAYAFKEPMKLPKGTRIELVAQYDNSEGNARNPNRPLKAVTWGEQTTDEMCIAFIAYTLDSEQLIH